MSEPRVRDRVRVSVPVNGESVGRVLYVNWFNQTVRVEVNGCGRTFRWDEIEVVPGRKKICPNQVGTVCADADFVQPQREAK